ncbi:MAG TPA: RNA-binding cell elongation regulator Jag/EloR [Candidatus Limnocylindrales bacterium]|nr:RNA-binding cell elongation regulator Jag/EloR [Candidatus Limnocylindrales bacterium]
MSAYKEFTGKSVEEALKAARDEFGAELNDLDFEILTPGSRGVLGMGAEPARIVAAPRQALGGAAPKRDAAASVPLPPPPARDFGDRGDRGPRREYGDRGDRGDRGPRRDFGDRPDRGDRGPRRDDRPRDDRPRDDRPREDRGDRGPRRDDRADRAPRRDDRAAERGADRAARAPRTAPSGDLSASEAAEVAAARGSLAAERAELEAAEASPEALAAGQRILETLMGHLGFAATVEVAGGETSRLNVTAQGDDRDALGALIGRKGERLSALQHLVNLMLSKEMGAWTRVLVDVEDYRGRRERQLRELADRAAARVVETGKMLQLEPMPALERRWIHLTLRDHQGVATQSIGEEPNRRVVLVPRGG